ncbi:MAG: biotin--[acetyl-CoA-carboxylase] ligase [Fimbriimonadaceae bacterium]|nr:biotin--[acetyl-CoA-carboxylase] ligase [Fimbriimonadaceae bacterium]QYK58892.1 MAG: biotin--[acetyl-CoA-carboxylase] ligase [Fimbriimonadaceae bacterium]
MKFLEEWTVLDEVGSTQAEAARLLQAGKRVGIVFAHHQTEGHGKFDRPWHSSKGDSLTLSLVFGDYPDHPKPWLVGMAAAAAAAGAVHSQLQWPNDLTIEGRKLGGVLTQLFRNAEGKSVPVVGVGINLNLVEFPPEIEAAATSLFLERGHQFDPFEVARHIVQRVRQMPEPEGWPDLAPVWALFDDTRGKKYVTSTGQELVAIGTGPQGELIGSHRGETVTVLAADALFGETA